jgi:hypothetical protein
MGNRGGARGAVALVGVLAAALACCAAPSAASVLPGSSSISGTVKGSHGYLVSVSAADGDYTVSAGKGTATSTYTGSGNLTADGFEADFGPFGSASVTFQSSEEPDEFPFPGCTGGQATFGPGTLVGSFHFRGEGGYTTVDATSLRASRFDIPKLKCKQDLKPPRHRHEQSGPTAPGLAVSCGGVLFDALRTRPVPARAIAAPRQPPVSFSAEVSENAGPIKISRIALASGRDGSLVFGPDLKAAIVRPPAPFSGMARWAADPERWSGSLRVAFPGKTVRLTGGRLRAGLVEVHLEKGGYGYAFHNSCAGGG